MLKLKIILLSFVFALNVQAQNLVVNGSFEEYSSCPDNGGQLNKAMPWVALPKDQVEFLHACSNTDVTTPMDLGYKKIYPRTGLGFAAFLVGMDFGGDWREYLHGLMSKRLLNNHLYLIEYFVYATPYSPFAIKNLDITFSHDPIAAYTNPVPLNLSHEKMSYKFLDDTTKWVKVSGIYKAKNNEKYFIIGNFNSDDSTELIQTNSNSGFHGIGYFIDDVSVIPLDSISEGIPANAGPDHTIYTNDSVFIGQNMSGNFCNWYHNGNLLPQTEFGFYAKPTAATNEYIVVQDLNGVIDSDTAYVYVKDASLKPIQKMVEDVYPNPSNGLFTLRIGDYKLNEVTIRITDLNGRMVQEETLSVVNGQTHFELNEASGVYLMYVQSEKGEEVHRLIIQKG